MKIECRLAIDNDCNEIARITQEYEPKSFEGYINAFKKQIEDNYAEDSIAKILIAMINGNIFGHGKIFYYDFQQVCVEFDSPEGWYFNGIIVDSKYRRQGVAKSLSKSRENYIKESNKNNEKVFSIVSAENIPSIKYHESIGFSEF